MNVENDIYYLSHSEDKLDVSIGGKWNPNIKDAG